VYDWYDLFLTLSAASVEDTKEQYEWREQTRKWVLELMEEEGVRALPRDTATLGRMLDSR
jgi:hypothetical protein